jgi:hypothetical protein
MMTKNNEGQRETMINNNNTALIATASALYVTIQPTMYTNSMPEEFIPWKNRLSEPRKSVPAISPKYTGDTVYATAMAHTYVNTGQI